MTTIQSLAGQLWVEHLGWSLVQFLWQGTVIAFLFAIVRAALRRKIGAQGRYAMACATLAVMVATPVLTFLARLGAASALPWRHTTSGVDRTLLPWVVGAWFAGVIVCCLRLSAGWMLSARLRSVGVRMAPPEWDERLRDLIHIIGVSRPVRLLVSSLVEIPVVIGWWTPVILMPVGALTGLPPAHIESLLAHELAHVRRFDFLLNVIQSVAESALFYHPAIWWVSNQIRAEREVCCDDIAVAVNGDPITYARALAEFEACRPSRVPAVAATGGSLLDRIRRVAGETPPASHSLPGPTAALTMSLLWIVGAGTAGTHVTPVLVAPPPSPTVIKVERIPDSPPPHPLLSTLLFGPVGPGIDPIASPAGPTPSDVPATTDTTSTSVVATSVVTPPQTVLVPSGAAIETPVPLTVDEGARSSGRIEPQQPPGTTFRAGVDVVEMDLSVTDRDHKLVRGLSQNDFTILEDGQPQTIVAFSSVELPDPPTPSAAWMRSVSHDVETNELASDRLFVIILDDALIRGVWAQSKMREVAKAAINALGPSDEAAVIFSGEGWNGQGFTTDSAKLLKAVDHVRPTMAEARGCAPFWGSAGALRAAAEALSEVPHRRKTILYISDGKALTLFPGIQARDCVVRAQIDAEAAVRAAQRSNTNIYGIDPTGLKVTVPLPPNRQGMAPQGIGEFQRPFLEDLATHTGGATVFNTNEPASRMPQVLEASRSYYLLGYQLTNRASVGLYHRVEVKVNRPGLDVHARTSRYDPKPEATRDKQPPSPEDLATSGYLPDADLKIAVTAVPFRAASGIARASLVMSVNLPAGVTVPQRDTFDVVTRVFTVDGRAIASAHGRKVVSRTTAGFDFGSLVDLKPGRYSLRIAVQSTATGRTGSVYTDVVVPNFKDDALSLSGAVLTSSSTSLLRADVGSLDALVSRSFTNDDGVQAYLRVYQGGSQDLAPVEIQARLVDVHDVTAMTRKDALPAAAFSQGREAGYSLRLPLSSLKAGEYWLSIDASIGKRHVSRDVRLSIK